MSNRPQVNSGSTCKSIVYGNHCKELVLFLDLHKLLKNSIIV